MKKNLKILLFSFMAVIITAVAGNLFTTRAVNSSWYQTIKPSITPPNFIFPIAWTTLFILMAFSLYLAYISVKNIEEKKKIALFYGINFFLNMLWSFLFFFLRRPDLAFFYIIFLWISILLICVYTWKIEKKSSILFWPYLLWVSFATLLNYLSAFNILS